MNRDVLTDIIRRHIPDPGHGAEIGVSRGKTSEHLLRQFPALTLVMVDSWATYEKNHPYRKSGDGHARLTERQQAENRAEAYARTAFADERRIVLQYDSVQASKLIGNWTFDFVIVDDDHTYQGVKRSVGAWRPLVRPGGLLIGDDIDHPRDRRGLFGVRKAVEELFGRDGFSVAGDLWVVEL